MKVDWHCEACPSTLTFNHHPGSMRDFALGIAVALLAVRHRTRCEGKHYEAGDSEGVSFEDALLRGATGESWGAIKRKAAVANRPARAPGRPGRGEG